VENVLTEIMTKKSYTKGLDNKIKYKILFSRINSSTPLEQHIKSRMIMLVPTMLISLFYNILTLGILTLNTIIASMI
jgi:hypothetical protein